MGVLIIIEHDGHHMHSSMRHLLNAAVQCATDIDALVIGHGCRSVVEEVALLPNIRTVIHADAPQYAHPIAELYADIILSIANSYAYLLMSASTFGKNILPRVAALLHVAQVSDVVRVLSSDTFEHPIYAGNALETVRVLDDKKILTVRCTAFDALDGTQAPAEIKPLEAVFETSRSAFVGHALSASSRPELGSAKRVVAGGRGLQSKERFSLIEELADALGAAVGASRAAVDAGFVSNDYQVGQTGKVVAPELYVAVGISGAVQHMAGMKDAKVIVAINKDPDAPIFQIANYGLVGDLFTLVPELIISIKTLKKE